MAGDVIGQIVYIYSKDNVEQIIHPAWHWHIASVTLHNS